MHSKNASPLTKAEIEDVEAYILAHPNTTLGAVAFHMGMGVPGLKQRALKAGYSLESGLRLRPLFPKQEVDK